jgi:hypothetical protein
MGEYPMRRRLEKFLPVVLIALAVQILAPIGACWAAAVAASDPLAAAEICHTDPGQGSSDQSGQHQAHDGVCALCCAAQASAAFDTPQTVAAPAPYRAVAVVAWKPQAPDLRPFGAGSNAQARAPPALS